MIVDLKELEQRVADGLIRKQKHDTLPLLIWNYTENCAYDNVWDEYTLMARGLITDLNGTVIARPFKKFFNVGQVEETMIENLPASEPKVYEKLDGSLGILYFFNGNHYIATRGSFNSEQAKWATNWLWENISGKYFIGGYTYLFEIIYPENRIVVNYGDRAELVLLAIKNIETEEELDYIKEAEKMELSYAKPFNKTLDKLIAECKDLPANEEGFVLVYPNLRVKIKGDEYVRLHRLITGFSTKSIWECLKNGQSLDDILKDIPDEFYQWVREKEEELWEKFDIIKYRAEMCAGEVFYMETRKEQAQYIMKLYKDISGVIFQMIDGKDYRETIWKMIKPKWELPFKEEV